MYIMHDRTSPQITHILSNATVAGAAALPMAPVRQGMFDGHALPQLRTPLRRLLAFPHLLQQGVIRRNTDAAARRTRGTALSHRTVPTRRRRALDHAPTVQGTVSPPGHRSAWRSPSNWNALFGTYGPCRTGQAWQKIVNVSLRCGTNGLAREARSLCHARSVHCCAATSAAIASVTLASGALAGVTPTATIRRASRSRSTWRLSPSTSRLRLCRPWRISASSTLIRRSAATPWRRVGVPCGAVTMSCVRTCSATARLAATWEPLRLGREGYRASVPRRSGHRASSSARAAAHWGHPSPAPRPL